MGKRSVIVIDETEYVTPPKAPRRLKLAHSVPKEVQKAKGSRNSASEVHPFASEKWPDDASNPTLEVLANTPSRMDDIREEQERRFRIAVCQSTGAILRAVLQHNEEQVQRAEIYAYYAVQIFFMHQSFRHTNLEVATLSCASKALKDSGSGLSEDGLIKELREQQRSSEAQLEVCPAQLREEMAKLEQQLLSWDGTTRYTDLRSLVDHTMEQLLKGLSEDLDDETRQAMHEAAHRFAVDSMLGPAPLAFRPETLAAVTVAMGARWVRGELKDEILKQIHGILQDKSPQLEAEMRPAMREVTNTLRLKPC